MRIKRPDKKNALSLIEASRKTMDFTLTIKVEKQSASTIVRNIYECFRMLGDAILVSKGIVAIDHVQPITVLMKLQVDTKRPLALLDTLRMLRHNINYYGYEPSLLETEDAISIARACFSMIYEKIKKDLQ